MLWCVNYANLCICTVRINFRNFTNSDNFDHCNCMIQNNVVSWASPMHDHAELLGSSVGRFVKKNGPSLMKPYHFLSKP